MEEKLLNEFITFRNSMQEAMQDQRDDIKDIKHILVGVDGENGVRSKVKLLTEEVKLLRDDNIRMRQTILLLKWLIPLLVGTGIFNFLFTYFK